jgi:peptidoglycan/xylan/chitin deacetylase (PgdA/CDA1 family)
MAIRQNAVNLAFTWCRSLGIASLALNSTWRRNRLLILCWHGFSLSDQHLWNPGIYLSAATFRRRLELLRRWGCVVLPLGDALERLSAHRLPPKAVAITIDDGDYSVFNCGWPLLREYRFPATLYWTTYYSTRPYAVFDPMLSYLLWKAGTAKGAASSRMVGEWNLTTSCGRASAWREVYDRSVSESWSAEQKEGYLVELAVNLHVDYPDLKRRRILHNITCDEARQLHQEGLDLQLHTHRHRVPRDEQAFAREIVENASNIVGVGAEPPRHFCYPSGSYETRFPEWLRRIGIVSATTCEPGLVDDHENPHLLPRVLDGESVTESKYAACVSGLASLVRRPQPMDRHGFG